MQLENKLPIVPQNGVWPSRSWIMELLIKTAFQSPISALEIGVWFGVGSTSIWLNNLPRHSSIMLLDSWRPYASENDLNYPDSFYKQTDAMSTDAFLSAFLNVKKFENEQSDRQISTHLVRANSASFLPCLRENLFDFIYIDGDHKYQNIKNDIKQAKRLVNKRFGIICGDDLEKFPSDELVKIAKNHLDLDYLRNERFHPGVLLAVSEEFLSVNMVNGFWWIVCSRGQFDSERLKPLP